MAQYDVHRARREQIFFVDCQSDLMRGLSTRFVVPLLPPSLMPEGSPRLNPQFRIEGQNYILAPQGATSVFCRELGPVVTSLASGRDAIIAAIDLLITGV